METLIAERERGMNRINQSLDWVYFRLSFAFSEQLYYRHINRARNDLIIEYGIRDGVRYAGPRKRRLERQLTRYCSDGVRIFDLEEEE